MDRNKKIQLLKTIKNGAPLIEALTEAFASIPSWQVNQYLNLSELEKQQCKTHGCKGCVIENKGKHYFIPLEPVPDRKANWFENEA